ncbi:hypothetical protein TNCV_1480161 [Trichonephila clavipes]|nr:hypothetical protein TNCV_1480161 [Trichonephila clavipes]
MDTSDLVTSEQANGGSINVGDCFNRSATQGLLFTDHVILNHGKVTWTTQRPPPNYHTTQRGHLSSRQKLASGGSLEVDKAKRSDILTTRLPRTRDRHCFSQVASSNLGASEDLPCRGLRLKVLTFG